MMTIDIGTWNAQEKRQGLADKSQGAQRSVSLKDIEEATAEFHRSGRPLEKVAPKEEPPDA